LNYSECTKRRGNIGDPPQENRPFTKIIQNALEARKVTVVKKPGYLTSKNFDLEMHCDRI